MRCWGWSTRTARAGSSRSIGPGPLRESADTCHVSVVDEGGRAVSMTVTLNASFGAGLLDAASGVMLNNEMDDFAVAPNRPNLYGLVGGEANAIVAGKRPLSSMTPTIVEASGADRAEPPLLILGSPHGPKIITAILQVILNVVDHEMALQAAVDAPRFHHQWLPDRIQLEAGGFSRDVRDALQRRGHELSEVSSPFGCVNAIGRDGAGGWIGAADPRRESVARGY